MPTNTQQITLFIITITALVFLLAVLIIVLLIFYQKRQINYHNKLNALKLDFEKNLLSSQVEIQEQTFQSISREIHDNISLSLTLVKLNLNTLDWNNHDRVKKSVSGSIDILGTAISDLSHLSRSMNTDVIKNMGLMKAVKNEIEKLREMAHLDVAYEIKGEPIFLDSEKEIVIFRIIQEAFNNIIKHAKASCIWLELDFHNHFLDILIKDDGVGFTRNHDKEVCRAGMGNMETRAKLFGGKLVLETLPEKGTQILVSIPY